MSVLRISGSVVDYGSNWSEYRKWLDGTVASLRLTWAENDFGYDLAGFDGPVFRVASIQKSDPKSSDQEDFEQNFKVLQLPFEQRSADGGLVVSPSPYAYSSERTRFVGHLYSCGPGTTNHDEETTKLIRLQGGYYWVRGATVGDRVSFSVVDVNNILGKGPGFVVAEYVKQLPVAPWDHQQEIIAPTAGAIPPGLFLRLSYENQGSSPVSLGVTYRWFESPA
jgi:hypothetical protein